jgi:hypothetical protein
MTMYKSLVHKTIMEAIHQWEPIVSIEVAECNNQTITVKKVPFWFISESKDYVIAGTDIKVLDYVGNTNIGLLYLSKPVLIKTGNFINLFNTRLYRQR